MPVLRTPSVPHNHKAFSPYDLGQSSSSRPTKGPCIRIHTPSLDSLYSDHDLLPYDGYNETHWITATPIYSDAEIYESAQCPPSFLSSHFDGHSNILYDDEPLENNGFPWPYDANAGYDSSFSSIPEPSTFSNTFSPSISLVSCSPRSESSGLSLSPQPNPQEYLNANFGFMTHQFPSSSSSTSTWSSQPQSLSSPQSSTSHSPSGSCSSLDAVDIKKEPSAESSPRTENNHQQSRRRFPCVIIGCERRFTSQYTLKVHMEAHKPKPRSSFPCTLGCQERFSRQHDRLRHEVAKHGKICEFSCEDCGRFFSTKKTLGNHKCPVAQGGTRWVNN